jgi:hypothetical protein
MHDAEKYKYYFQESNSVSIAIQSEIPRLMEVFKKDRSKVFFLRYEDFTMEPIYMLKQLYNFLEQDWFEHDLDNIQQSFIVEHDHAYFREKTDHVTNPVFQTYSKPKRTLPEEFHTNVMKNFEWFYRGFYPNEFTSN